MKRENIPTKISDLPSYLFKVMAHLIAEATRLGISNARILELKDLYGDNTQVDSYVYCKMQYDAASGRKDTIITENLKTISKKIKTKLRETFNDIPASVWTDTDREIMKRRTGLPHTHTVKKEKIKEECNMEITVKINGVFNFGVNPVAESKRCHLPQSSNAVEIAYAYVQSNIRKPDPLLPLVKEKCLGPEDNTIRNISTTSRFQIKINPFYSGYNLYCWGRWTNLQHPNLAGNWSPLQVLQIS